MWVIASIAGVTQARKSASTFVFDKSEHTACCSSVTLIRHRLENWRPKPCRRRPTRGRGIYPVGEWGAETHPEEILKSCDVQAKSPINLLHDKTKKSTGLFRKSISKALTRPVGTWRHLNFSPGPSSLGSFAKCTCQTRRHFHLRVHEREDRSAEASSVSHHLNCQPTTGPTSSF